MRPVHLLWFLSGICFAFCLMMLAGCDPLPGHDDRVMTCEIAAGFAMDQDCR